MLAGASSSSSDAGGFAEIDRARERDGAGVMGKGDFSM